MNLESLEREIKEYASQKGIKLIEGLGHGETIISFEPREKGYKQFIDLAKELIVPQLNFSVSNRKI